ncbi:uncharacterized protein LY79DRAFT_612869 [Colletotrichum navitas]|uniref:Rhodopsin domain-containing protein n=1 Tax=Colletotrichum navitas TaxID=681940 RepID=A0AAD8PSJ5_9PEZI|nr:uncharacterized protein LY79DRAFT_612869 [Colletotrichum navitas]KAK1579949.1 hypothetical protein LY79DRAFT_612869 [Colletotrichum navitas]
MEAPPGVHESDSRASVAIAVNSVLLSILFLAVGLRTYTRFCILKQVGNDDLAAIVTFFLVFGSSFAAVWNVRNGLGRHIYFLSTNELMEYMKTFYTSIVLYNAALGGIKMTFLLQYYRVLAVQKMKKVFIGAMIISGMWSVSQIFCAIFTCTPIPKFWDQSIPGYCIPNYPFWYVNAGGNIITDLMVLILPLPALFKLKLRPGQKYVLVGIFCLGFFTCAISVIRIRFLRIEEDPTWENVESSAWSISELVSGLTCACLPACRPLVSRLVPALASRATKSSGYLSYGISSRKGGRAQQQRDVEMGTSVSRNRQVNFSVSRRTQSSDSKTELYGLGGSSKSQEDWNRKEALPIQVPSPLDRSRNRAEKKSPPISRQESVRGGGYMSGDGAAVQTHIEAKLRVPQGVQLKDSIEITHDIVQVSSPKVENTGFV